MAEKIAMPLPNLCELPSSSTRMQQRKGNGKALTLFCFLMEKFLNMFSERSRVTLIIEKRGVFVIYTSFLGGLNFQPYAGKVLSRTQPLARTYVAR